MRPDGPPRFATARVPASNACLKASALVPNMGEEVRQGRTWRGSSTGRFHFQSASSERLMRKTWPRRRHRRTP